MIAGSTRFALLLVACASAHAGQVFKCVDPNGAIAYQATPCAEGSAQEDVVIRKDTATPAPPSKYNPREGRVVRPQSDDVTSNYKLPTFPRNSSPPQAAPRRPAAADNDVSYECRMSNGQVFYRHEPCPSSITTATSGDHDPYGKPIPRVDYKYDVTSKEVTREEACRQMNRPGAIGRDGRQYDQKISTYDKNLGRDPCR